MGAISLMVFAGGIGIWASSQHHTAAKYWPRTIAQVAEKGIRVELNGRVKQHEFDVNYSVNGRVYAQKMYFSNVPHETEVIAYNPRDPMDADSIDWLGMQPLWDMLGTAMTLGVAVFLGFHLLDVLRRQD